MPLSVDHVLAIEDFLADRPAPPFRQRVASEPGFVELRLCNDRLVIEALGDGLLIEDGLASWVKRRVPSGCEAIGLCVAAGDRRYAGAVVDHEGKADWFFVDDGVVLFTSSSCCQMLDDLCRRRLGQPTEPPTTSTDWYWLHEWLTDVALATWPELPDRGWNTPMLDIVTVASWHPAIDIDELVGLDRAAMTSFVVGRHRDHCVVADWSCVRFDAIADVHHWGHAWASELDDGAFSRWMAASGASLVALTEPLLVGCSPLALELIGAVISDLVVREAVG